MEIDRSSNRHPDENDDDVVSLTVNVTCDAAANCVYQPES